LEWILISFQKQATENDDLIIKFKIDPCSFICVCIIYFLRQQKCDMRSSINQRIGSEGAETLREHSGAWAASGSLGFDPRSG
jgi:hypothetical protein